MSENPSYAAFEIGEWSYGDPSVHSWGEAATLKIGKYCSIANEVVILLGGEHRIDWVTTYPFSELGLKPKRAPATQKRRGMSSSAMMCGWGAGPRFSPACPWEMAVWLARAAW